MPEEEIEYRGIHRTWNQDEINPESDPPRLRYEEAVPRHLRERSIAARNRAGIAVGEIAVDPPLYTDMLELGQLVDLESPEVCNLDAVAIRNTLRNLLTESGNSRAIPSRKYFRELTFADGEYGARVNTGQNLRIISTLNPHDDTWFMAWLDKPVGRLLFGRKAEKAWHLEESPFTIGYMKPDWLYVPLLHSVKTPTGCHILLPDNSEIDIEAYNKPEILRTTRTLLKDMSGKAINEWINTLAQAAANNSTLEAFLRPLLSSEHAPEAVLQQSASFIEESIKRSSLVTLKMEERLPAETLSNVYFVASRGGIQIPTGNGKQIYKYWLCESAAQTRSNNLRYGSYILRGGLDPSEYGASFATTYRRFELIVCESGTTELVRFKSDGITYDTATEAEEREFYQIVTGLTFEKAADGKDEKAGKEGLF